MEQQGLPQRRKRLASGLLDRAGDLAGMRVRRVGGLVLDLDASAGEVVLRSD